MGITPHVVFMRCYAHQLNLMVCGLLKCQRFSQVSKEAIAAAKAITASSSKWLPKLLDIVEALYGTKVTSKVLVPGETRWNSMQVSNIVLIFDLHLLELILCLFLGLLRITAQNPVRLQVVFHQVWWQQHSCRFEAMGER